MTAQEWNDAIAESERSLHEADRADLALAA